MKTCSRVLQLPPNEGIAIVGSAQSMLLWRMLLLLMLCQHLLMTPFLLLPPRLKTIQTLTNILENLWSPWASTRQTGKSAQGKFWPGSRRYHKHLKTPHAPLRVTWIMCCEHFQLVILCLTLQYLNQNASLWLPQMPNDLEDMQSQPPANLSFGTARLPWLRSETLQ